MNALVPIASLLAVLLQTAAALPDDPELRQRLESGEIITRETRSDDDENGQVDTFFPDDSAGNFFFCAGRRQVCWHMGR